VAGADQAPLRLGGLEMVAHVDIRNFAVPFRWPFAWNPLKLTPAAQLDCTVRFSVLREHFTPVHWFYEREEPVALQHGLRLRVTTTGSVGYFSWHVLLTKLLLAFTAFTVAQSLLDAAWYYLYPHSRLIAEKAFHTLDLRREAPAATEGARHATTDTADAASVDPPASREAPRDASADMGGSSAHSDVVRHARTSSAPAKRDRRSPVRRRRGPKEE
jgi:hypothetical protein